MDCKSVRYVKGVGPVLAKELAKLGIITIRDLLWFFPYRYEDRRDLVPISSVQIGDFAQIKASVIDVKANKSFRKKIPLVKALLKDGTGSILAVWFNKPYLFTLLKKEKQYIFYGKVIRNPSYGLELISPEVEMLSTESKEISFSGKILPVYPLGTKVKISQKKLRKIIYKALDLYATKFLDKLSEVTKGVVEVLDLKDALWQIHFPSDLSLLEEAKKRFVFEEFFLFSLFIETRKRMQKLLKKRNYKLTNPVSERFLLNLPFKFTQAQEVAVNEICDDLLSDRVMRRLLQGDVGSGKTVVAFYCASVVLGSGYQVAMMVPTEVLARQHYEKAKLYFREDVKIELLVGSMNRKQKEKVLKELAMETPVLVIGTHTLIGDEVEFGKLGLVIIDEEHRFGVKQRVKLASKAPLVDVLVMTATPIPRSLAMTLYGDLDVTFIRGLPPKRQRIETLWITSEKRDRLYKFIREKVKQGRQVYIVYPIINELEESDLLAAEQMYEFLREKVFPELKVGILHGKMRPSDKSEIMQAFRNGDIDILIATVVIEVGIDVPNASVMVIEHAERFGLSQLHQLRGRIGRGSYKSYCIVVSDVESVDTKRRLGVFVNCEDGFKLSEADLLLRGPGKFLGEVQHGPTEFRLANPIKDFAILQEARKVVRFLLSVNPDILDEGMFSEEISFMMSKK